MIYTNSVPVGVTWIDSQIIFGENVKNSRQWIGVCHMTETVWMFSPYDYKKPTMITGFEVDPIEMKCEKADVCVHFKCRANRFMLDAFIQMFADWKKGSNPGAESLGLPIGFGSTVLWYNEGKYLQFWGKLLEMFDMHPDGGTLDYSPMQAELTKGIKF